ncbi:peptidylprolyl isomerase PrsA [Staphylococcus argenteus]|uniref:peptidylprolyl isomerase PrsA n=1 Tax=Staphylococcus argenteus TaxID=985002 RepID=UPI000912E459|nr:foldase protein PrsA [Staphylococcus argenteus]SHD46884.1 Foldase protein prsA [Staphylococcus argenteus]
MKMINKLIVPVTASALLLGACGSSATDSKENTLISSKAGNVTVADTMKKIGNDQIANASFTEMLNKILADKYKNKVSDKKIDEQIEKMQKQYGGKDKFGKALQQQGLTVDKYKDNLRTAAYQKELLNDKIKLSDSDIKENSIKASHILIKVKSKKSDKEGLDDKEAKQKAEEIQKEVSKDPSKFGEIAKKESMDKASAEKDGSLGYVLKGQTDESFEKALFKLKEGEVSDVIKTSYGYHIIKADKPTDFKSEKQSLKEKLIQQKIQKDPKLLTDAYKELLKEYDVDFKDRDIKSVVENKILNPEKLKQNGSQGGQSGMSQ